MKKWFALTALSTSAALTGCGGNGDDSSSDYLASMYPAGYLLERITGEDVDILTPEGADPHDLELTASQTGRVHDASLVVLIGGIQPAMDAVADEIDDDRSLDLADVVELRENDHGDHDHGHDDGDHAHEDDHDHDHGHEDDHDHDHGHEEDHDHDHDHGPEDPHFWTDPSLMIEATDAIVDRLSEVEPDRSEEFRANADDLIADLGELDEELSEGLGSCERQTFITGHQAFGYLADRYGLEEVSIAGITTSDEASPATIARVVDEIESTGVTTVFTERLASADNARTVADEAGVDVAVLDPIEGLNEETASKDYIELMRENLEALRAANDCA